MNATEYGPITAEAKTRTYRRTVQDQKTALLVVKTRPEHSYDQLRDVTAEYLLTTAENLKRGDEIAACLPVGICAYTDENGIGRVVIDVHRLDWAPEVETNDRYPNGRWVKNPKLSMVTSHLGRRVTLGEDGAEDAFGNSIVADVAFEKFCLQQSFKYTPVQLEIRDYTETDQPTEGASYQWNVAFESINLDWRTSTADNVDALIERESLLGYDFDSNSWKAADGRIGRLHWVLIKDTPTE